MAVAAATSSGSHVSRVHVEAQVASEDGPHDMSARACVQRGGRSCSRAHSGGDI